MIENNLVKKIVQGIKSGKKTPLNDRSIMHPEREWFSSVLLGLVFLVAGGYWSLSVYLQFSSVDLETVVIESEAAVYRDSLVEAALFEINRREQAYNSLKGAAVFAPPPLEVIAADPAPSEEDRSTPTVLDVDDLEFTF